MNVTLSPFSDWRCIALCLAFWSEAVEVIPLGATQPPSLSHENRCAVVSIATGTASLTAPNQWHTIFNSTASHIGEGCALSQSWKSSLS